MIVLAVLALTLALVDACRSSAPGGSTGLPPQPPPSGILPPSPGDSVPVASLSIPATPSSHAGPELEAMLPTEVRGLRLTITSVAARDLAGTPAEASLTELAQRVGRPLSDLTLAAAVDSTGQLAGGINAMRLRSGSGAELLQTIVAIEQSNVPSEVSTDVLGGREVTRLTQRKNGRTITRYLLASGEVVFVVLSPDQATAIEFIEALP